MVSADEHLNSEMESVREELRQAVMTYNDHSGRSAEVSAEIEALRNTMIDLSNQNVGRNAENLEVLRTQ